MQQKRSILILISMVTFTHVCSYGSYQSFVNYCKLEAVEYN